MYGTLVPTAKESEAEEAARWDYSEDAKRLPEELIKLGITRETFSDALFALADNVRVVVVFPLYVLERMWEGA